MNNNGFRINKAKYRQILDKYSIFVPENYNFSDINVIIGANGAGKTRFLHAIRDIYRSEGKNNIMYGYFPGLSHNKSAINEESELPICTLYESLQESDIEFEDFLREIELHNEEYIPQLLTYHSRLQKERGEKALDVLIKSFFDISGKKIVFDDNTVCIANSNGEIKPLKEVLSFFSPGELMIFYMSVFLSLQKSCNKKRVIILDEPECHLHPKALLKFIQSLKESKYFESIWIATHSLFVIPEFDFNNIVHIDNSEISPRNSKIYKNIIDDLLGEDIDRTSLFIASLSQWQYCEFIAECFVEPEVVDIVNPEDEQVLLFLEFVKNKNKIKVLDFGGGSARLGRSIKQSNSPNIDKITYEIYDSTPQYSGKDFKVYNSLESIAGKYDCIVMMNVLHEINPDDWVSLFSKIDSLLNETGYLLFVEAIALNKGERPNETGFLVLSSEELQMLFFSPQKLGSIIIKETQKSVGIPIPKKLLKNISSYSVDSTIKYLENRLLEKIKEERKRNDFETSRYYAFLTQMYINAKLYNDSRSATKENTFSKQDTNKIHKPIKTKRQTKQKTNNSQILSLDGRVSNKLLMDLLNELAHITITDQNLFAYAIIYDGLSNMLKGRKITFSQLEEAWSEVQFLERKHEAKETIALLLLSLYILGEIKAKNRLENNGYMVYLEKFLKEFAK